MLGCCDGRLLLLLLLHGVEEWVRESLTRQEREERKKIDRRATVTMHICTDIVAIVHKCTILHPLMWVFFLLKMYKMSKFFYFARFYTY